MATKAKVQSVERVAEAIAARRGGGKTKAVVQCHGVFDLLHIGHIRHFEQAKRFGDVLVVTVTPDRYVNKGTHRPAFNEDLRAEAIAALDCVDYVAITRWPTAVEAIQLIKPDVYAKGADYRDHSQDLTGKIAEEEATVRGLGGRVAYTDDIVFSSSGLINRYLPVFPPEVSEYLAGFSERHTADEVLGYLRNARQLRVLAVGEAIIDEYHYCDLLGKSAKEPILAALYTSCDKFAGGILAVANHVANFCDEVGVATMLGQEQAQEEFVRQHTTASLNLLLYKPSSPTIVKRRFVERHLLQKVFEVYEMNDSPLDQAHNRNFCATLEEIVPRYDVVIVADYGHGMLTREAVDVLCSKAGFLAVNTQANAGNRGFNTISKYPRADYVCLAEPEIVLEERNHGAHLREMVLSVANKLQCRNIIVTRGKNGCLCYGADDGFADVPAFASRPVDRMGAGDAVLSLTAPCVAQHAPMEVVGFIGNVAGAQAVATLGHSDSLQRASFFKHVESLLK